jgi:hypothetical protein
VTARQPALNPGELPIHDLMLHGWIDLFGESIAAMRAMSALLGVVSIALVYFVTRELFVSEPGTESRAAESTLSSDDVRIVAALAALIFAVNLVTIKYSREARMYPVMLAAILAQVGMFLRALRIGGLANFAAVAVLTALAIASNFSALLVPVTEAAWLVYVVARTRDGARLRTRSVAGMRRINSCAETSFATARGVGSKCCWRRHRVAETTAALRADRAVQQGIREFRLSLSGRACNLGRGPRMAPRARRCLVRAAMDVASAAVDGCGVVRDRTGVHRALRALVLRSLLHTDRAWNICDAR